MLRSIPLIICTLAANVSVAESATRSLSQNGELNCSKCQVIEFGICESVEGDAKVLTSCVEKPSLSEVHLAELFRSHAPAARSVFNAIGEVVGNQVHQPALFALPITIFAYQRFRWSNWICENFCLASVEKDSDPQVDLGVIRACLLVGILYSVFRLAGMNFRPSSSRTGYADEFRSSGENHAGSADRLERWCLLRYFGLNPNASAREIRKSYRQKLQSIHPDTNSSEPTHFDTGSQIEDLRAAYFRIRTFLKNQ